MDGVLQRDKDGNEMNIARLSDGTFTSTAIYAMGRLCGVGADDITYGNIAYNDAIDYLFCGDNTAEDVRAIAEVIAGERL